MKNSKDKINSITNLPLWKKKLPMQLTMSRIFAVPLIVYCLAQETAGFQVVTVLLIMAASITDYYDGYFARKYGATSTMGKFMDPIADKILVSSVLIFLMKSGKIDPYMVTIIIARDTLIGGIRSIAATDMIVIDAKPAGKWKTAMQMIAIPAVIFKDQPGEFGSLGRLGYAALWISTILSITSGIEYYRGYLASRNQR